MALTLLVNGIAFETPFKDQQRVPVWRIVQEAMLNDAIPQKHWRPGESDEKADQEATGFVHADPKCWLLYDEKRRRNYTQNTRLTIYHNRRFVSLPDKPATAQ